MNEEEVLKFLFKEEKMGHKILIRSLFVNSYANEGNIYFVESAKKLSPTFPFPAMI